MKRTGFKKKYKLTAFHLKPRKPMNQSKTPLKRTRLHLVGHSTVSEQKQEIQALVRLIVCIRDGGCILRKLRYCSGEATIEDNKIINNNVIQADHLITRANSATFADTRLIVCLCKNCHAWKKWNEKEYNALVRSILPKDRVVLWDKCEKDRAMHITYKVDWKIEIISLKQELSTLQKEIEMVEL